MQISRNHPPPKMRNIRVAQFLLANWLIIIIVLGGILNILPFLAPVAMRFGWTGAANAIYAMYVPLCHQMAQRSFFLFGPETMYNADQLPVELIGDIAEDMLSLRVFNGSDVLGWKVAWSDRMVYLYGSAWFASILYWIISRKRVIQSISLWVFGLLALPMILDGFTHVVSDYSGITQGFRYNNDWLARLTRNTLPDSFYVADAFGSFNSWMRFLSGGLFGIACVALGLPLIDSYIRRANRVLTYKIQHWHNTQRGQGRIETSSET